MAKLLLLILICAVLSFNQGFHLLKPRVCIHLDNSVGHGGISQVPVEESPVHIEIDEITGQIVEHCQKHTNFCYALWKRDHNESDILMGQGCWGSSSQLDCKQTDCVAEKRPTRDMPYFCCCSGDLCNMNVNVSTNIVLGEHETVTHGPKDRVDMQIILLVAACIAFLALLPLWVWWVATLRFGSKPSPDAEHLVENTRGAPPANRYTSDQLQLLSVTGQGRYGSVWKALVGEQEFAVKIFPPHHRGYFLNERDIYCLPFMDNPALLTYYGSDKRVGPGGCTEYMLILSYASHGCLQDYLRAKKLDWATFCRMSLSVAKGLAHLHSDILKGDKVKPCVSHRDLNSRNILVKADLSCCICDLGFAMKIVGSKYYQNGEELDAETKSINDVGTLRYMAPEVLEGAVNLRDCESSLKQIDVYALGLVLWELATRCADIYQTGAQVPPYRAPFEAEIGEQPSFEQMQVLVSRHKARPLFPEQWKDWAAVGLTCETMEDCWDQDAEARLTALCVEERLSELPSLWERQRASLFTSGLSPTVNPTNRNATSQNNVSEVHSDLAGYQGLNQTMSSGYTQRGFLDPNGSEGTVETLVTLSPSEPIYASHIDSVQRTSQRCSLQPFQGRNPCMERNLMPQTTSEEDLSRQRVPLVDRSAKHSAYPRSIGSVTENDTQSLVANDFLDHTQHRSLRSITPIPYVQNVVYGKHSGMLPAEPPAPKSGLSRISGGIRRLLDFKRTTQQKEKATNLMQEQRQTDTQVLLDASRTGTVVTTTVSKENSQSPPTRPTSLAVSVPVAPCLTKHYDKVFSQSAADGMQLKNPSLHVKTPGDVPASVRRNRGRNFSTRLSLYDDRIMTGRNAESESDGVLQVVHNTSASVPYEINSVSETQLNDSTF